MTSYKLKKITHHKKYFITNYSDRTLYNAIKNNIHPSWKAFFSPKIILMLKCIDKKIGNNYVPLPQEVLRFAETNLTNIKVVVFGRDPYPGINNNKPIATGRSFEVRNYNSWMTPTNNISVINLLKALYVYNYNNTVINTDTDTSIKVIRMAIQNKTFKISSPDQWFNKMEATGVLWLNKTLTCERNGKPGSHEKLWQNFSQELVKYINKQNSNIRYLLWGESLSSIKKELQNINPQAYIIEDAHPASTSKEFIYKNAFLNASTGIVWIL